MLNVWIRRAVHAGTREFGLGGQVPAQAILTERSAAQVSDVVGTPKPATILVVDDVAGVRGLLRKLLARAGYSAIEATNGKEALQLLRTSDVDLVLTDLVMP